MRSQNIAYIPSLDQLRGIAALWILLFHAHHLLGSILRTGENFNKYKMWEHVANPLLIPLIEGHTAVALFMVLSGFIFTWGAYGKTIRYREFITNRLLRIYPLYLFLIFVGIAAFPRAFNVQGFITMLLPLSDFNSLNTGSLTAMAWAVGVEFQFYLLFPLLFSLASAQPKKTILLWIAALILMRALIVMLGGSARDISYWHLAGRMDQFLLGMLAAFWLKRTHFNSTQMFRIFLLSLPLSLFLLILYHFLGGWPSNLGWKVIWPTLEGAMWALFVAGFVGGSMKQSTLPQPNIFERAIGFVGVRSFSIYLLHYPIIQAFCQHPNWLIRFTGEWRQDALLNALMIILPIVLAVSEVTWQAIEKPFLNLRKIYLK